MPLTYLINRQWTVFCTSVILIILSWVVTPLQSGIFTVSTVQISQNLTMLSSPGLISLEEQDNTLTMNFMNEGYDVAWLNMDMPPFTTRSYALAPFLPSDDTRAVGTNQTWTGNTVLYQTDLDCQPAESVTRPSNSTMLTFNDGHGCDAQGLLMYYFATIATFTGYYTGYNGDGPLDTGGPMSMRTPALQAAGCNASALHEFLAIWSYNGSLVAMFCWTKYYTQDVEATISLPENTIESVRSISERKELSEEAFNYTRFEQIIVTQSVPQQPQNPSNSTSPQTPILEQYDVSDTAIINQLSRLQAMGVSSLSMLTPFALGFSGLSPQALLTPSNLQNAFQDAHRALFSLAVHSVMDEPLRTGPNVTGALVASAGAVVLIETFTYIVIGSLGLIVLLTLYLLLAYRNRILHLPCSPNSIASVLGLARHQMEPFSIFHSLGTADDVVFKRRLEDECFRLQMEGHDSCLTSSYRAEQQNEKSAVEESGVTPAKPWPWVLRRVVGVIFILVLTSIIAAVCLLRDLIQRNDGE
jgi:hypothetical protein